ncbi:dicarboxylate/amino acid:cation symporter [Hyphomicrobium sp. 802]|uniref:dicarboxylate/amino acid:cation symporter n=1 Tax=Hyphomicrobium sp. 802 TaxID=1112272 RepID=UPI0004A23410|nr:dicarboxylate/amino acid:cation symporter [Hyphomicrobium sp. 802]
MQQDHETMLAEPRGRPFYTHLYFQVLTAIALGVGLGHLYPSAGEAMKPLGDGFVKLIKMLIGPIIFVTVVHGIASMGDLKKVGRVGIKALIYFEVLTTLALVIGLVVVNVLKPGAGMNVDIASLDAKAVASFVAKSKEESAVGFILDIIPNTFLSGFVDGNILQVLLVALLFAFGLQSLGPRGKPMLDLVAQIGDVLFKMVGFIMKLAPIGAFGAMAFTIGRYGIDKLSSLAFLMFAFYLTCLIFLFGVLGVIARLSGFSILRYLAYIKDELLIVLGTSSSESVLPRLIAKMRKAGCEESVVGLVVPTGYSFNLDGTCIYLTMAAIFLAQATNTELTIWHEVSILGVLLLTSKGAAGVTGSGFITLAATLSTTSHIPVASLALILGIDRFMSEGRALMNLIGNGIATIVIAKSEGAIDEETFERELGGNGGVIADAA